MINLVLKDLFLQKKMVGLMFLYILLFSFSFKGMDGGQFIATLVAVGYMFITTGCAWEDKNKSDVLWNSLPISRRKIVGAKYLSILAYVALTVPAYWLTSLVIDLVSLPLTTVPITILDVTSGTLVLVLISSIYLPIFFALGYTKSRYWNMFMFLGIFFLALSLPSLFSVEIPWLERLLGASVNDFPLLVFAVFTPLVAGTSYLLSLVLYRRREF